MDRLAILQGHDTQDAHFRLAWQGNPAPVPHPSVTLHLAPQRPSQRALALHHARRQRATEFCTDLFGEPAWDMLLDLFVNKVRRKVIRTESLCIAAGVPHSTAWRWIKVLERRDLLTRTPAHDDSRAMLVDLTPKGFALMRKALARFVMQRRG